mmetsp:Transcript_60313/g.194222  ORF Transcript_60313/g.194222 Transcript_60313/m.194222 type:complete len:149 (-) Transcript_60313:138-584(-)
MVCKQSWHGSIMNLHGTLQSPNHASFLSVIMSLQTASRTSSQTHDGKVLATCTPLKTSLRGFALMNVPANALHVLHTLQTNTCACQSIKPPSMQNRNNKCTIRPQLRVEMTGMLGEGADDFLSAPLYRELLMQDALLWYANNLGMAPS